MKKKNKLFLFSSCLMILFFVMTSFVKAETATDCEYGPTEDETRCMTLTEWCNANPTSSFCGESSTVKTGAADATSTVKTGAADTTSSTVTNGLYIPTNTGLPDSTVKNVLTNVLGWLLGIVGVLGLIGFIISGIQYVMVSADEELVEKAKKNMTFSIIGMVVALAGYVIIQAIDLALRGTPWF